VQHPPPTSHQRLRRRNKKTESERELIACLTAVKEVHGPHSVKMAAEHWIEALDEIFLSNMNPNVSFRRVTFSAVSTLCH
jgi:hypothetical protein